MPGWKATRNGRTMRVRSASGPFQAVDLPAGRSRVSFAFAPPGAEASLLALLVALLALIPWRTMYSAARPLRAESLEDSVPVPLP